MKRTGSTTVALICGTVLVSVLAVCGTLVYLTQQTPAAPTPAEKADLARLVWEDADRAKMAGFYGDMAAFLASGQRPLATTDDFHTFQRGASAYFAGVAKMPEPGTYENASREIGRRIKAIVTDKVYPLDDERNLRALLVRELESIAEDLAS